MGDSFNEKTSQIAQVPLMKTSQSDTIDPVMSFPCYFGPGAPMDQI